MSLLVNIASLCHYYTTNTFIYPFAGFNKKEATVVTSLLCCYTIKPMTKPIAKASTIPPVNTIRFILAFLTIHL